MILSTRFSLRPNCWYTMEPTGQRGEINLNMESMCCAKFLTNLRTIFTRSVVQLSQAAAAWRCAANSSLILHRFIVISAKCREAVSRARKLPSFAVIWIHVSTCGPSEIPLWSPGDGICNRGKGGVVQPRDRGRVGG